MLFQRMPVFRAMLVFYAMLARELPYTILAQILQCWRRKTVVPFTWQFTCRFNCGNFSNNNKALLHMCKWSIWPKWNLHRSEFHYTRSHVNVDNEVTTPKWNFTPKWNLKPVWNLKPLLKSRSVYMAIYMKISLRQLSKR